MSDAPWSGSWHIDAESLHRWVDGAAGPSASVSVEQHLLRCERCRAEVAVLIPDTPLRGVLDDVLEGVLLQAQAAQPGLAQRTLSRLGVGSSDSLVMASALTLRLSWLAGVIAVMFFALVAATFAPIDGVGVFLVGAPLVPVAGVAAAYSRSADPLYELVLAAPYATMRLVLLRTATVLVTCAPLIVLTGLLLPTPASIAVAWLLPAAGFIAVVLAASSWVDPTYAAVAVGAGWVTAVVWTIRIGDRLAVLAPAALIIYAAVAVLGGLLLLFRLRGAAPSWRLR